MGLVFFLGSGEESPERMPDAESQWSTSWVGKAGKWLETEESSRASGPLCRVDH